MEARAESVDRTRRRVLEAATDLFGQRPFDLVSLADIAKTSGIGLATVVRQFESKERLFAEAVSAARPIIEARTADMVENDPGAAVRIALENYEQFGDVIVRLVTQEERVPVIREVAEHGRRVHRAWVERVFTNALERARGGARKVRFAQLMAATDVLFWKLLRRDLKLGRRDTERAMIEIVEALCR